MQNKPISSFEVLPRIHRGPTIKSALNLSLAVNLGLAILKHSKTAPRTEASPLSDEQIALALLNEIEPRG